MTEGRDPLVVILMGVSGVGKTTIGRLLAESFGADFQEGDAFHSPPNLAKMSRGDPLNDDDRGPWLAALVVAIDAWIADNRRVVLACSALKQRYREILMGPRREVRLVYLKGSRKMVESRLKDRKEHFMPVSLLASQYAVLEEPRGELTLDAAMAPTDIVECIRRALDARAVQG